MNLWNNLQQFSWLEIENHMRFLVFVAWAFACVMYHSNHFLRFWLHLVSVFFAVRNTRSNEHVQLAKIGQFCNFIGTFPWESYFSRIASIENKIILISVFFPPINKNKIHFEKKTQVFTKELATIDCSLCVSDIVSTCFNGTKFVFGRMCL